MKKSLFLCGGVILVMGLIVLVPVDSDAKKNSKREEYGAASYEREDISTQFEVLQQISSYEKETLNILKAMQEQSTAKAQEQMKGDSKGPGLLKELVDNQKEMIKVLSEIREILKRKE